MMLRDRGVLRGRPAIGWLVAGVITMAGWLAIASRPSPDSAALAAAAADFCAPAPIEARASATQPADREIVASVPLTTPAVGETSVNSAEAVKNDVVRIRVSSSREGSVAVHGLLEAQPVRPGDTVVVAFRAIYSGRFPLHFHGSDGSHFEIAAFEVRGR